MWKDAHKPDKEEFLSDLIGMLEHIFSFDFDGTKPDFNEDAESLFEIVPF